MKYLYMITGEATKDQVLDMLEQCSEKLGYPPLFDVNYITIKKSNTSICYVQVESDALANLILGLNEDGSERTEMVPDENWKPPTTPLEEALKEVDDGSWGGTMETEDEIRARYERPMTIKPLPSLCPHMVCNGDQVTVELLQPSEPDNEPVLFTMVPHWVTRDMIYSIFRVYASDQETVHVHRVGPRQVRCPYPFINIIKGEKLNKVYINFDPNTSDAGYAIQMNKFFKVTSKNGSKWFTGRVSWKQ